MKSVVAAIAALGVANVAAQHGHHHRHHVKHTHGHDLRKRNLVVVEEKVEVLVTECWLGGRVISQAECDEGVRNGTLQFIDPRPAAVPTTLLLSPSLAPKPAPAAPASVPAPVKPAPPPPAAAPASAPAPAAVPAPAARPAPASVSLNNKWTSSANVDSAFPDGEIPCSEFPEAFGAVRTDWLDLGGWASVQKPEVKEAAGFSNIKTLVQGLCPDGNCCVEGSYCSYACPNGYLKSQWPNVQGATGQSVGGLLCQGGKLRLSNPSVRSLCTPGAEGVKVFVENKLSQKVAICRTNYPGDEKMSIPVDAAPGSRMKLACPDSAKYYKWEGKGTSAQYYINMPGYSIEKACVWGNQGDDFGNFAPGNLGVGYSNGLAWLSIQANHPTQMNVKLPYTIELIGGNTKCRYRGGQYCGGPNYESCSTEGCTVSAAGGEVTYVLS